MSGLFDALLRWLERIAGVVLLVLVVVTLIDVVGRYLFANPLHGGHVLVQILVSVLVFLGLPLLVTRHGFIRVELADRWLSPAARRARDRVVGVVQVLVLAVVAGQLGWQTRYFGDNGEYFESIRIPVSWVAGIACLLTIIAALCALRFELGRRRDKDDDK